MLWYLYAHRNATEEFWKQIELPNGADEIYVCIGVKASNYFMPAETLSDKGPGRLPGGEGWVSWTIYGTQTMLEWRFEGWKFGIYVILCLFTVVIGCTWYTLIYPMSNPIFSLINACESQPPPIFFFQVEAAGFTSTSTCRWHDSFPSRETGRIDPLESWLARGIIHRNIALLI